MPQDASIVYFSESQAAVYPPLQALMSVGSKVIEDYMPAFDALLRSGLLVEIVTGVLSDLEAHRGRLDMSCEARDWRLLRTELWTLGVRKLPTLSLDDTATVTLDDGRRRTVAALPNDAMIGVLGTGRVTANVYRATSRRDGQLFDRGHRVEFVQQRELAAGDHLVLRAADDLVDFVAVTGEVVMIEFALRDAMRIVWNYYPDTLQAAFASSASVEATRMEFAIELFQRFKERKAVPTLLRIAREHTHHWVRWKAVKAMLHIDLDSGLAALDVALRDPHDHVRKAAQTTLNNFRQANLVG